uniref:Nonsense-mediated mRNA decay factor SMG8 n=1 Tax=Panagrolaimus sp. ES5 TaxID=591445 RepID=A0AC34FZ72_9BILA
MNDHLSKHCMPFKSYCNDEIRENAMEIQKNKDKYFSSSTTINNNNSTLSLHIEAYENLVECDSESIEGLKSDGIKTDFFKNFENAQHRLHGSTSFIQNPFEFPRQKKEDQSNDPEVMQFKTSQRLLNPNVSRASNKDHGKNENGIMESRSTNQNLQQGAKSSRNNKKSNSFQPLSNSDPKSTNMAHTFRDFLENASELYKSLLDESLLIVSVIGKDSKTWKKSDIINKLCGTQACLGQIDSENPEIFIEAYLSTEDSTLFFVLHGVHDFDLQTKLFASDEYKNKSFFEKLAKSEYDELSLLHLLFLLSHLVVVVEQGRYFDTTYMKTFADVNQMRLSAKDHLIDELLQNSQLPKMWSEYGRLSCPRICFLFPDRCIRHELPQNKKKEIAEKLELGWEAQIFNNLKHIRIVDTSLINCLIVLPEDVRYVHVAKSPSEEPRDLIVDLLSRFLDNSNSIKDDEDIREPDYCTFLRSAMQNILRYGDRFKNFNCFPTLKEFIIGAQITYNTLIKDAKAIKLEEVVPELAIAQS